MIRATRTYLELRSSAQLRPRRVDDPGVRVARVERCTPAFWRSLYEGVGGSYHWVDRLAWSDQQIAAYLEDPTVTLFVMTVDGAVTGYYELKQHADDSVEIAYFGLLPGYQGRGLGAHLLNRRRGARVGARAQASVAAHLHARPSGRALQLLVARLFDRLARRVFGAVAIIRPMDPSERRSGLHRRTASPARGSRTSCAISKRAGASPFRITVRCTPSRSTGRTPLAVGVAGSPGVIGEPGDRVIVDQHKMPGARFFPDARLSFPENVLRQRGTGPALIFNGEGQRHRTLTHDELRREVARFASALRSAGIRSGDRVAGYMPNMPEAIVAALGAAAVGAVWSSCSPDFGVQGVLDRFGQIEPHPGRG